MHFGWVMSEFRPQQVKGLKKLLARQPGSSGDTPPERFLLQYVFMEALVRLIGNYYRTRHKSQGKSSGGDEPLNIVVVHRSLLYFELPVHDERLALLFESKGTKRWAKSARQLRNGLVHRWDAQDGVEVTKRYGELEAAINGLVKAATSRACDLST